jgi:cytochrome P450
MSRKTAEPLEIDGYEIPSNTNVILCNFLLHRNPLVFPNPDQFVPERFAEGEKSGSGPNRSPYAYVPFSAGPRNCIGQKYVSSVVMRIRIRLIALMRIRI